VTLYAAGTAYGSGAVSLGTTTSGADGSFSLPPLTCPGGNPQTYLTASGGNVGLGANSAIGLMAALGPCNNLSASTRVTINELTTAAAQWALAQFLDSTGHTVGAPAQNAIGLQNAYISSANLADTNASNLSMSGNPSQFLPSGGSCPGSNNCDALERLNTLANILAGCVGSTGPSSNACAALMCDATPGLTYTGSCSETPTITDTLGAAYLIVTNPVNNASALFGLAASTPFSPVLESAPDGWEMALEFAQFGAAFEEPFSVALDGSDNVFVANYGGNSVSELTAASNYNTGLKFAPSGASFDGPASLAVDGSGNIFVANYLGSSVSELTAASNYTTGYHFAPSGASFEGPASLAVDGSGNVFAANYLGSSVSELTAASSYSTGLNFAPSGASFNQPYSLALDGSGNVFAANYVGNSVSELTAASSYTSGSNSQGATFKGPESIALDGSANVFVANSRNNSVSELTAASNYLAGFNFAPTGAAFKQPVSLAVDGSGNVFVANSGTNSVSELTVASSYAQGFNFAPVGAFDLPESIAVDASGNLFVANGENNSVGEILGLAKPVVTPIESALPLDVTAGTDYAMIKQLAMTAARRVLAQFFDSSGDSVGAPLANAIGLRSAYIGLAGLADISSSADSLPGYPDRAGCVEALDRYRTASRDLPVLTLRPILYPGCRSTSTNAPDARASARTSCWDRTASRASRVRIAARRARAG